MRTAWVVEGGRMPYGDAWSLQRALVAARQTDAIEDAVLLVEHPPVITVGRTGRSAHILVPRDVLAAHGIGVYEIERGGDVTYHGPGQLVGYPILDLRALDEDVVRYVRLLEATLIEAMSAFGVVGGRLRGYPGVWVGDAKIGAVGVAVKRKVTMHGFALNVAPDLAHFALINPCGLGKPVTTLAGVLGRRVSLAEVQPEVVRAFGNVFDVALEPVTLDALRARVGGPVAVRPP